MSQTDKSTTDKDESNPEELDNEVVEEVEAEREEYVCPECSKVFDNENSLKMHMLRSHRVSPHERKKEKPMRERGKPPAYRPPLREAGIPDAYLLLRNQLLLYGLSSKDADAVTDYMKSFNPDDVLTLNRVLSNVGMPLNRKRMFLESWINARDLPVSRELAKELDLIEPRKRDWRREYGFRSLRDRGYPEDEEMRGTTVLDGMANVIRALKESEGAKSNPQLMREIGQLETQVANLTNRPPVNTGNDQVIAGLQQQVSDLSKKLDEAKEKRLFDKIDTLTKEVQDVKNRATSAESAYGVINTSIISLKELAKEYFDIAKVAMGWSNPRKPPKRQKIEGKEGQPTIVDYIKEVAPELVEEG